MLICKTCGYDGPYQLGKVCPNCGREYEMSSEQTDELIRYVEQTKAAKEYEGYIEGVKILADFGCTEYEREYGIMLERGELVERNYDLAMEFFHRGAQKNDSYSAYRFSRLVNRINSESGRFWLIYSAILGCNESYFEVAEEFDHAGLTEDANYFYYLAAACNNVDAIVVMANRYYEGKGIEQSLAYAKWYMDKLRLPPIYAIKLAYKIRNVRSSEPPRPKLKSYDGLIKKLIAVAEENEYDSAYLKLNTILADRGDLDAVAVVGVAYITGYGTEPDFNTGLGYLISGAANGSIKAAVSLGDLYIRGEYTDVDFKLSEKYYERAGELGGAIGFLILGDIYYEGRACKRDIKKAVFYYDKATLLGSPHAYEKSRRIKEERERLYKDAFNKPLGERFENFLLSAEMGYTKAQIGVAECYAKGEGVKKSSVLSFAYYKSAADDGESSAYLPLGLAYATGFGTKLDYCKATEYLKLAVHHGYDKAAQALESISKHRMKRMSQRHYSRAMELIYQKKISEARRELEIAADLTNPNAIYTLGCLYEFGICAPCDKERAYRLYESSYRLGFRDPRALYKLFVLKKIR